ncbi:hypothetical protein KW797_00235 [Candidatus Parcubacteria bacterium]|nr:hypothetical protein [Candidatus Parcubacteria bacterium]
MRFSRLLVLFLLPACSYMFGQSDEDRRLEANERQKEAFYRTVKPAKIYMDLKEYYKDHPDQGTYQVCFAHTGERTDWEYVRAKQRLCAELKRQEELEDSEP